VPAERVNTIVDLVPDACRQSAHRLQTRDDVGDPRRHQVTELPAIEAYITEYRCHRRQCRRCGTTTLAPLPEDLTGQFGPQLTALIAYLTVVCRLPRLVVQRLLPLSLGSTQNAWEEVSAAVTAPYHELQHALPQQPVLNGDETGHRTNGAKRWLWTLVAPTFIFYAIATSRGSDVLQRLLGATFAGTLGSDRLPTYLTYAAARRQFCWSHFKRNLLSAQELATTASAKRFCREALALQRQLFRLWHRYRGSPDAKAAPLTRAQLIAKAFPIEKKFFALGERTATIVPGARPDVERLFPEYPYANRAGWGYLLLTNVLPSQGNGVFTITAIAQDVEGNMTTLGSRTIVANNATATQPFGAIDTPQQGETISGASYVNFGWALTPKPKTIPKDGSTVTVFIDGAAVGNASYNHFRQDIASLFPGLNNTDGGVGFRMLDTTALADGLHTIAWVVSDDSGAAEGIGSRYFTVANGSAQFTSGMLTPPALRAAPASASVQQVFARQLEPIEIDLSSNEPASCRAVFTGIERVGAEQRALPVGSTLDRERGVFRWQPGPGFAGTYRLSFDVGQCDGSVKRLDVDVTITR